MAEKVLNPRDHAQGRYLLREVEERPLRRRPKPYEATVVEWAPSGTRVKLRYPRTKHEQWIEVTDGSPLVVEKLPD